MHIGALPLLSPSSPLCELCAGLKAHRAARLGHIQTRNSQTVTRETLTTTTHGVSLWESSSNEGDAQPTILAIALPLLAVPLAFLMAVLTGWLDQSTAGGY